MTETLPAAPVGGPQPEGFDLVGPLPTGTTVLEASAGTGKTYAITALAVRYLAEGRFRLDEVMMVTFSRAATGELRSRVHERLVHTVELLQSAAEGRVPGEIDPVDALLVTGTPTELIERRDRLRAALGDIDQATIATTHEFCQQMLTGLGMLTDHDATARFVDDVSDVATQVAQDVYLAHELTSTDTKPPHKLARWDQWRAVALAATIREPVAPLAPQPAEGLTADRVGFAAQVRGEFEARMRRAGLYTFDDMVGRLRAALLDPVTGEQAVAALAARYPLVLIDEFQDTDPTQWEIVEKAFAGRSTLVLIGDPKQAIYAFRGADVAAYLQATQQGETRTLPTNHRSDAGVVAAVLDLFAGAALGDGRIVVREVSARHEQPRIRRARSGPSATTPAEIRCIPRTGSSELTSRAAAQLVDTDLVNQVVALLTDGWEVFDAEPGQWRPLQARDIAVLVRRNRRGEQIRRALVAAGVGAVFGGADPVMRTTAARDWLELLTALCDPRTTTMKRAALTSLVGWDEMQLAAAVRDEPGLPRHQTLGNLAVEMKTLARVLADQGVAAVHELLCEQHHLYQRLLARPGGERLLTDIRHVAQLLQEAANRQQLGPAALVDWLADRIDQADAGQDADRTRRLETDRSCVQVMTVHGAKGLEFPVVLLPEAADSWQPEDKFEPVVRHEGTDRVLDVGVDAGRKERWAQHLAEERAESLRTLYVAATRAKSRLVMWWAPTKENTSGSPLHRLLNGPRRHGATPDADYPLEPTPVEGNRLDPRLTSVVTVPAAPARVLPAAPTGRTQLRARTARREIDRSWRRTSYSGLTADVHGMPLLERPDGWLDDEPDATDPGDVRQGRDEAPALAVAPTVEDPLISSLAPLPGGVQFGSLVHGVLELVNPQAPDLPAEVARHVDHLVTRMPVDGLDAEALARGVLEVLDTPLGDLANGLRLADIAVADRLAELDFELPLGSNRRTATLGAIAAALCDPGLAGQDPFAERYGQHLAASPVADKVLRGFLTGSIDAVLRLPDQRHLVVDYKTNRMPTETDLTVWHYTPPAMARAMIEAHYPLQALLYCAALHRYLSWRLPGYDPARHLGGVGYLFVRGMAGPETPVVEGMPCGVFTWHPAPRLVVAVSELLGGLR